MYCGKGGYPHRDKLYLSFHLIGYNITVFLVVIDG